MGRFSRWLAWSLVAGGIAVAGCGSAEGDAAAATQAAFSEPPEVAHLGMIQSALAKVTLRADQKTEIDKLAAEAKTRHESIRAAHLALQSAVADQVLAGKIDRAALKPQTDAFFAAIEQSKPADRAAFVRLHDLLDKNQRDQFVSAVEAEFHDHGHGHGHGPGPGRGQGPRQWAADLHLTDQQRDQIRTAVQNQFQGQGHEGMREQWKARREQGQKLLESFRQDQFVLDPNASLFGRDRMEQGVNRMLDLVSAALPILKPEQRAIAAEKIRTQMHH